MTQTVPESETDSSFFTNDRSQSRKRVKTSPLNLMHFAFLSEPTTIAEVDIGPNTEEWRQAMKDEIDSHIVNQTWSLADLPAGRKALMSKWVFKEKRDQDGNTIRYKARLVAKGCSQVPGIDFEETYSPVVRYASLRYLFALAVRRQLKIHQMDAITAYLHGEVREEIYMQQPEKFDDKTGRVCRLHKAIYGLKQAGMLWNKKLDQALSKFGLQKTKLDPCIYRNDSSTLFVAIYVDDFLMFYQSSDDLNNLKKFLNHHFRMKDVGAVTSCLGMRIIQGGDWLALDQGRYILDILNRFGMADCNPICTPRDTHTKLSVSEVSEENSLVGKVPFQEAVGSLLYVAQCTRRDISFAVNDVSRFNNNHSAIHSMEKCVTLFCDNESTIKLSRLDAFRPRTKHIDILTKPVTKQKHEACARKMGLLSCKNY